MKKAALHNLGCKVNAYETEAMQQMLEEAGYEIVPFSEKADVYVINTCSVTNMADRKSRQMLHRAKKRNPDAAVVAAGCYVQTKEDEAKCDEAIDILIGNNQKKELELLKIQEQYSHQYIENASQQYDSIRKIRHDLKDQLSAVYTMIVQGHADESMKYIEKYVNVISISESFVNTDNYIVNAIINSKFAVAATEGIRTNCSCIKSFDGIDDIDMLHILSNTLDNAITASEKITDESERFINLDISKTMDIYRIVVRNAINESVLKRNPSLKTTKLNVHKHGWGIKIIREIAEKYQGRCEFYESDKMFTCLITLKSTLL